MPGGYDGRRAWPSSWLGLALLVSMVAACGSEQADSTPPQVVATEPVPGATAVAADTNIRLQFDEDIDRDSLNQNLFHVVVGGRNQFGTVSYDLTSRWATLVLLAPLPVGEDVTAVLEPGVRDLAGNRRSEPYSWPFTVAR